MKETIELFREITDIPRCSRNRDKIKEYLTSFAKNCGYEVEIDSFDNILCFKGSPKICFQAHYDMVCIGKNRIEIVEVDGFLKAKNGTSLGADNGIAMAMMLKAMQNHSDIEFLFTSDEEIGLIGATNLELKIKSNKILNLDSEDENHITIGCAGGFDISADFVPKYKKLESDEIFYEIEAKEFSGGHSGADIDKHIKNAIKEAGFLLNSLENFKLIKIEGGEARNSIAKHLNIIISSKDSLTIEHENFELNRIDANYENYIENQEELIELLVALPIGVLGFDRKIDSVVSSLNFGIIKDKSPYIELSLMGRANHNEDLKKLMLQTTALLKLAKCKNIEILDDYPAWNPENSEFSEFVKKVYNETLGFGTFQVIHAGLECGILKDKFENVDIVSIGPNINYPHSSKEEVELKSVENILRVVEAILDRI